VILIVAILGVELEADADSEDPNDRRFSLPRTPINLKANVGTTNSDYHRTSAANRALLCVRKRHARMCKKAPSSTLPAIGCWRGCRLALQGGTRLSLKFNGLAETEVPFLAFQSRLAHALWALKMEFVDRSIDRGIFDRNVNFAQGNSPTALPFQLRLRAPESHME